MIFILYLAKEMLLDSRGSFDSRNIIHEVVIREEGGSHFRNLMSSFNSGFTKQG